MSRRGMTLVEMMVALAATLVVMAAIAQAFAAFGDAVSGSRSVLELDSRMRAAAWRLRSDLAGATARPVPPLNPAAGEGYLEIIEGPATDYLTSSLVTTTNSSISGDHDDVLLLTTRSAETPFTEWLPTMARYAIRTRFGSPSSMMDMRRSRSLSTTRRSWPRARRRRRRG
jgi:prepilin-type N-terminal cleavage/methylation domain-containing protein